MTAPESERRRPAWDEVQERQRRARAKLDAEHAAANAIDPDRPRDVWRKSGQPVEILRPELWPLVALVLALIGAAWALADEADRQRRHR